MPMLSIFVTTELIPKIETFIHTEDRLSELVKIHDSMEVRPEANANSLIVDSRGILTALDWQNTSPPYLLSNPLPLEKNILLALIFSRLDNDEKAWSYLEQHPLLQFDVGVSKRLQYGYQIGLQELNEVVKYIDKQNDLEQYRLLHNSAVVRHYGYLDTEVPYPEIARYYEKALEQATNEEYRAFTAKHYSTLLLDAGELEGAIELLETCIEKAISEEANFSLKAVLTNVWMKQLVVPYDEHLLEKLKSTLWEVLQFFEKQDRNAEAGLLLVDAAHIANISDSFSESLGYISKAIRIFEEEELEELAGNAFLRKGTLLYTWAQNGNPQFYKPAIESYQQALKVFRQELAPDVFADIHHNLAVLYSEIPSETKKRGIWAGVAVASFQEALKFYTKDKFPYEYGMITNNYGNALTKFPQAIHSDNYEKALFQYQEALDVRTPQYPYERAITLLNYLETSWNVSNHDDSFNEVRFADMLSKAREVKTLVKEPEMLAEAQKHLDMLAELKQVAENS